MKFKGKVVLVTGSSRGIGKAIALRFAKDGAKVVVNYAKAKDKAEETCKEIEQLGAEVLMAQCDVSDEDAVRKMVDTVIAEFGTIDILVNNAGIVVDKPFFERTKEDWEKTIAINLMGPVYLSKHVGRHMKEKKVKGAIVNISSRCALDFYHPDAVDYDVTKAGVNMITKDLAIELAPLVRVNAVAPGFTRTEMTGRLSEKDFEVESKKSYLKRCGTPEDIASAVLFLASDEASYITGEILKVDGGYGGWM